MMELAANMPHLREGLIVFHQALDGRSHLSWTRKSFIWALTSKHQEQRPIVPGDSQAPLMEILQNHQANLSSMIRQLG